MKLGNVVDFLKDGGYPITSIQFKSPKMRGWYQPVRFSTHGETLVCRNLTSGQIFEWRWDTSGGIRHQCEVLKVLVERTDKDGKRSVLGSDKLVTLYLSDRPIV